jgi:hypothetical protein
MNRSTAILLAATGLFVAATAGHAIAMPVAPIAAFADEAISVNCKAGGPNCTPAARNAPKFCNPCQIDTTPTCQNAHTCGTYTNGNGWH